MELTTDSLGATVVICKANADLACSFADWMRNITALKLYRHNTISLTSIHTASIH